MSLTWLIDFALGCAKRDEVDEDRNYPLLRVSKALLSLLSTIK